MKIFFLIFNLKNCSNCFDFFVIYSLFLFVTFWTNSFYCCAFIERQIYNLILIYVRISLDSCRLAFILKFTKARK